MTRAALIAAIMIWLAAGPAVGQQQATSEQVKRGEYLITTGLCHDCHTPLKMTPNGPEPDMSRALSGHPQDFAVKAPAQLAEPWVAATTGTLTAWSGPWGVSFSANLTPDPETGIGRWTEADFVRALRTGIRPDGLELHPFMPWRQFSRITDDDASALFRYLRILRPIRSEIPRRPR